MRNVTCFMLAAALAATPALAQNDVTAENAADTNEVVAPVDNNMVVANDLAVAPAPATAEPVAAPAPAPARRSSGIPWGVIGLVGLVGLLGRRRRD